MPPTPSSWRMSGTIRKNHHKWSSKLQTALTSALRACSWYLWACPRCLFLIQKAPWRPVSLAHGLVKVYLGSVRGTFGPVCGAFWRSKRELEGQIEGGSSLRRRLATMRAYPSVSGSVRGTCGLVRAAFWRSIRELGGRILVGSSLRRRLACADKIQKIMMAGAKQSR